MNNLINVYNKLKDTYKLEWIDNGQNAFYLYFERNNELYKIYVDKKYLGYYKNKKGLFGKEKWTEISHDHFDNEDDTFSDLYDGIIDFINEPLK